MLFRHLLYLLLTYFIGSGRFEKLKSTGDQLGMKSGRSKVRVLVSAQKKGGSTEFHTPFGANPWQFEFITFNLVHMPRS